MKISIINHFRVVEVEVLQSKHAEQVDNSTEDYRQPEGREMARDFQICCHQHKGY